MKMYDALSPKKKSESQKFFHQFSQNSFKSPQKNFGTILTTLTGRTTF